MNYEETIKYIHSIPKFRRPLGNAQLARLLDALGNPQDKIKPIHIAGTNGKGSAAAMLGEILKESGYRTGMFTSPYIEVFNERIQINNELIADEELAAYTERVKGVMDEREAYVSEFAFITAVAFLYFWEKGCDYAVIETGMGGRLDATNIIKKPELTVLMSIGLDHTQYLGETIEEIASEKCGIMKKGCPTAAYPNEKVRTIIEDAARANESKTVFAKEPEITEKGIKYGGEEYELSLKGAYQPQNAAVVLEGVELLRESGVKIDETAVKRALSRVKWQARYEFVRENVVIDGGHNADGIQALKKSLAADGRKIILVMAMMEDKSFSECVAEITGIAKKLYATELDMPRCAKAEDLAKAAVCETEICKDVDECIDRALKAAKNGELICVCGSLYLAGEARKKFS